MVKIMLIPVEEFRRVREAAIDKYERLALLADMCRANALASVKRAGSGHLGSSFSSLDIVTMLYYSEMNTIELGINDPDRDVYLSSKGHDVPGLYAILFSLGILPKDQFLKLRRLGGTCGHPDVSTPGIEANSGSLGMGISKAKGMAFAKRQLCHGGRIIVMTGDGELQEGQIYEALPKLNCGLCGFANCGQFARAVVQGKAWPFGCKQNHPSGYKISGTIGMKPAGYRYGIQPVFASRPGGRPSAKVLRKEVEGLAQRLDSVPARTENLKTRRGHEYRHPN